MAYTASYTTSDLTAISFDFLGTMGAQAVAFASLIALIVIGTWAVKSFRKNKMVR